MHTSLVIGAQWGDEGKGKLVDILGESHSVIVRSGGGANAGHTIIRNGKKYIFHLLPSGLLTENNIGVIGNGCVVDPFQLCTEIEVLESQGLSLKERILISDRAHILFDFHKEIDALQEEWRGKSGNGIGTTKRGIGPCYADKITRQGIRMNALYNLEDLKNQLNTLQEIIKKSYGISINVENIYTTLLPIRKKLLPTICDTSAFLETARKSGKNILIEGAQAFALDIDFGTYPFVTSSSITLGGMASGCGISPRKIDFVIGVLKAYCTRVGEGPFPSELFDHNGEFLRKQGNEFGATTGRPRRCGWLDLALLDSFIRINDPDCWNLTKLDVLDSMETIGVVTGYEQNGSVISSLPSNAKDISEITPQITYLPGWKQDISHIREYRLLPENTKQYIAFIEEHTGVPVRYIGVGAGNDALLEKPA